MLIPALFVADAVLAHAQTANRDFDLLIFAEAAEVADSHRQWMEERGVRLRDDMDTARFRGVGMLQARLSPATLMKLFLAEHLAGEYDRVLYLDCDLTIHGDVTVLFALDTAPFALAATPAGRIVAGMSETARTKMESHFDDLGMSRPHRYFNTGVLCIDVARWNREDLGRRVLDYVRRNPELCSLPDEDGLNAVLDGDIAPLSPIWNARPTPRWHRGGFVFGEPVIVHYAGPLKPWRRFCYGRDLFGDRSAYRLYEEFLCGSPWEGWLRTQWGWRDVWLNLRGEAGRAARRLVGRLDEPGAAQRRAWVEAFERFCAEEHFADVEQRIAIRENGRIRLRGIGSTP
jgi:lipopolysaccharide biosynthesis glycosyltransferase